MSKSEQINEALNSGIAIIVSTHMKATRYTKKHSGLFFMKGDSLYVKNGKSSLQLSIGSMMLVKIFSESCQ